MELKKIIIHNFKSIKGDLELDFERIRGFWKLGGSVGAGKTTIGEAILFGLFGRIKDKNNKDLITWNEKECRIELFIRSKGNDLYIKRTTKQVGQSLLYITVNNEEITFTNKVDAQEQLEKEYYDVSRMMLELLCIISFNNFKSLATLNQSDTRKFLDQVFGFYILTNYSDICKEFKSETNQLISESNYKINNIESQINKIKQLSNIEHIEGDIKKTEEEIHKIEQEKQSQSNDINLSLKKLRKDLLEKKGELEKIKVLGSNKKKEIDFILKGKCPTCGAPIDQSSLEIKKQEREILLSQYNNINNLINNIQKEIITKEQELKEIEKKCQDLIAPKRELKIKLIEQEKRLSINTQEINTLNDNLKEEQNVLQSREKDLEEWGRLYNILSTEVRQKILCSFIPLLNQHISFYTRQFQLPYEVIFDESFSCVIKLYNIEKEIPISSLSTGQLKTVDICIILGVLKTIMKTVNFNISFFDELISNMDHDLRDTVCKVLKSNLSSNQTLFMISHVDIDKNYFDGIIESKLVQQDNNIAYSTYDFKK